LKRQVDIRGIRQKKASLTVERLIATYRLRNYEKGGRHLGPIMAIIVVIGSISSVAWGLAEVDPGELQYQCGGIPLSTRWRMILIYKTLFFVDALAMITFAFCYYHNAKTLRNGRYELSLRYQIYENLRAIRIFFPLAILHFIIFCLFFLGSITIRELRASLTPKEYGIGVLSLYIFPYYILAMCALLFVVLRKESARLTTLQAAISEGQSEKEQSERHFRTLQDQWTKKASKG
ncbi:integral membrane protein, partial [Cooperia oncophora]